MDIAVYLRSSISDLQSQILYPPSSDAQYLVAGAYYSIPSQDESMSPAGRLFQPSQSLLQEPTEFN